MLDLLGLLPEVAMTSVPDASAPSSRLFVAHTPAG